MKDLLFVAIRNVGRNKRRSFITALTVFIGVLVVSSARGLLDGLQNEIRSGLTRKVHGDLQLHKSGYQDSIDTSPYHVMFHFDEELKSKILSTPEVVTVAPRIKVMALLNHQKSQTTFPVMVQGIDTKRELDVCPKLATSVTLGKMIDSSLEETTKAVRDDDLEEAVPIDSAVPKTTKEGPKATGHHQILVTPGMMRGLKAELGDEIVMVFQDQANMQQAVIANIVGVVDFALPGGQNRFVWMDFKTLQETLNLRDEVSELAIRTTSLKDVDQQKRALQSRVGETLVAETYLDVSGLLRDAMSMQNAVFTVILAIIFVIVIAAIVNTSLMTVMERTREIGTLMALGYKRRHILFLFLAEAATIGLSGGLIGLTVTTAILKVLAVTGINFSLPGQVTKTILYPEVTTLFLGFVLLLSTTSALIAGFVPAYKASRLKPVDALSGL